MPTDTLPVAGPAGINIQGAYLVTRCWGFNCNDTVPDDPEHLGLCEKHLTAMRGAS